jgi:hypothetical protein
VALVSSVALYDDDWNIMATSPLRNASANCAFGIGRPNPSAYMSRQKSMTD